MAVLASSLPPGVSPPLTEDNDHNHNGLVVIVTSLALFLVLASLVIRLFASSKRGLMLQDDHVLFAAAVCQLPLAEPLHTLINLSGPPDMRLHSSITCASPGSPWVGQVKGANLIQ